MDDRANELFLSVVSAWEIGIKSSIGKLRLSIGIQEGIRNLDLSLVPVTLPHALRVADLPLHHRDPFDRLLIAQAMVEDLTVLTSDAVFSRYGVAVMSV